MAQLRHNYPEFRTRNAEVLVVGPDEPKVFRSYWESQSLPMVGLLDPDHRVADLYGQEVVAWRLGRMPSVLVIDLQGQVRFVHYGCSMRDIPKVSLILSILDRMNQERASRP